MSIQAIFTSASQQLIFVWLLIVVVPFYLVFASLMARGLQILYMNTRTKGSLLYSYFGDISWILPFREKESEFKLTQIILLAILIAVVSLVLLTAALYQQQTEKYELDIKARQQKKIEQKKQ